MSNTQTCGASARASHRSAVDTSSGLSAIRSRRRLRIACDFAPNRTSKSDSSHMSLVLKFVKASTTLSPVIGKPYAFTVMTIHVRSAVALALEKECEPQHPPKQKAPTKAGALLGVDSTGTTSQESNGAIEANHAILTGAALLALSASEAGSGRGGDISQGASSGAEVAGQRPALPTAVSPQTKSPGQGRGFLLYLVPEIGIEPTTYALRMRRSTN